MALLPETDARGARTGRGESSVCGSRLARSRPARGRARPQEVEVADQRRSRLLAARVHDGAELIEADGRGAIPRQGAGRNRVELAP